ICDGHRVELSDDLERRLVMEIRASALNLLMILLKQFDRFTSPLRSLLTSRDFALSGLQFPFGFAQEFRVLDHLACRERGEVLDPDINPNRTGGLRKESGLVLFNRKDHIPTIRLSLNHAILDRPFNWRGKTNAARADLRQMQLVAFQPESALRVGEGIVLRLRLEPRIPAAVSIPTAPEEGAEGLIDPAQGVLKNLTMNLSHVFTNLLDLRKLDGLGVIVDRKAVDSIGVAPFLERRIVKLASNLQGGRASGHKLGIGLQFVFVRLHLLDYTLVPMVKQQL